MNTNNKNTIDRESDLDNTNSTSAFHEHVWWIALVVGAIVVFVVVKQIGGFF